MVCPGAIADVIKDESLSVWPTAGTVAAVTTANWVFVEADAAVVEAVVCVSFEVVSAWEAELLGVSAVPERKL